LIVFLHVGHNFKARAQPMQQQICPHGINNMFASPSKHTCRSKI